MTDDLTAAISRLHRTSVSGDVDADIALVLGALAAATARAEKAEAVLRWYAQSEDPQTFLRDMGAVARAALAAEHDTKEDGDGE